MESDTSSSSQETLVRSPRPVPTPRRQPSSTDPMTEEDIVDKILAQSRTDRMYELRRIQMGEKPVTGTDRRERLEKLLAEEELPEPTEHRPQAVLVEVHDLSQSRPVHAVLQSQAFRTRLEAIVRGSITTAQRTSPRVAPRRVVDTNDALSTISSSSSSSLSALGAAAPRPARTRDFRQRLSDQLSRRVAQSNTQQTAEIPAAPPLRPEALLQPEVAADPHRVAGWLASPNREPANSEAHLLSTLEEAHREDMVFEITELVHRQLVTSTLESDFRARLEAAMTERHHMTGSDGRRVANFINTLPRGQIIRNDFSHLGLEEAIPAAVDDSVSFVSAQAVPISHTNAMMSREIASLRAQLKEMKQMMQLTFDLQLDLQRSIRQEVAAALASVNPTATIETPVRTHAVDETKCVICVDGSADSVLYQCGHLCLCYACGMRLKQRGHNCPVCRAPIKDILRAYKTSAE